MWHGHKLTMIDTIEALEAIQWAYARADRVEAQSPREAERLRDTADSALSGVVVVLKKRAAPVPVSVQEALTLITTMRDARRKAA